MWWKLAGTRTGARIALAGSCAIMLGVGAFAACTGKQNSEIIVAMQTDLSLPKDIDAIRIEVTQSGNELFVRDYPVVDGGAKLPATLGIVDNPGAPELPIRVRIIARHQGTLRVLRQAITTIAQDRTSMLRMPIQWLCWNHDTDLGDGGVDPDCDAGQSCIEGVCADDTIDAAGLPDFDQGQIFGGGGPTGGGVCFDTIACFSNGEMVPVDTGACTIATPAPAGTGVNVSMVRGPGVPGICSAEACYIPIDSDPLYGWSTTSTGLIQLPPAVCSRLALPSSNVLSLVGVAVTTACATKDSTIPPCGPWSSVDPEAGTFEAAPPAGFEGGTSTLPDGGTCDPTTRWPLMLASPIVPPNQIAGLDLLNGGNGDLVIAQAENVNCTGTPATAIDPGYSAIAWGNNSDVFVEYNPQSHIPYNITVRGSYSGSVSFPVVVSGATSTCTIGVGAITCAPFLASNWTNATAMQAAVQQIYSGYMAAFFPSVTPAADCTTSGDCFANEDSNGSSALGIGLLQKFPLYVVFPKDQGAPTELYTLWADGLLGAGADSGSAPADASIPTPDAGLRDASVQLDAPAD